MSFAYAAASKGLLIWTGLSSFVVSTFGMKHYCHLQLVPHITRDHQLWRLVSRNLAFTSSIDLFVAILVLYNTAPTLERRYGTSKFVSFALVSSIFGTALEVASLVLLRRFGLENLPAGPYTLVFAILYNFSRSVPSSFTYKIFGLSFTSKSLLYLLATQLIFAKPPNSTVSAVCGLIAGALYRSNVFGSRTWRIPRILQRLGEDYLSPVFGTTRMPRRSTRTSLDDMDDSSFRDRPSSAVPPRAGVAARQGAIAEVMQTFASTRSGAEPPAEAVAQLQAMFPSATPAQIRSALQRGENDVNRSVEYLL